VRLCDRPQVPIFVEEESNDIQSLMKKSSAFGMGGWWLGGSHMKPNDNFLRDLGKKVPKDANVSTPCCGLDTRILRDHVALAFVPSRRPHRRMSRQ
jgi:hypothetical protein